MLLENIRNELIAREGAFVLILDHPTAAELFRILVDEGAIQRDLGFYDWMKREPRIFGMLIAFCLGALRPFEVVQCQSGTATHGIEYQAGQTRGG